MMSIVHILTAAWTQGVVLAQRPSGRDGSNFDWVVVIFVAAAWIIGALAKIFKKKTKQGDEDEIILEIPDDEGDELFRPPRPARPPGGLRPPEARRPRPPVIATPAGQSRPKRARRFVPPQQESQARPPLEPTLAERYPQPESASRMQRQPPRHPKGQRPAAPPQPPARGISRGQTPGKHARHIDEHADQVARHARQATSHVAQRHLRPATVAETTASEPAPSVGFAGLENVDSLRRAIVLAEILAPPIALRQETDRF